MAQLLFSLGGGVFFSVDAPFFFAVVALVVVVSVACFDCLLLPLSACCAKRLPEKPIRKARKRNKCLNRVFICRISG